MRTGGRPQRWAPGSCHHRNGHGMRLACVCRACNYSLCCRSLTSILAPGCACHIPSGIPNHRPASAPTARHAAGDAPGRSHRDHVHPPRRGPHRRPHSGGHDPTVSRSTSDDLGCEVDRRRAPPRAGRGVAGAPRRALVGSAAGVPAPCPRGLATTALRRVFSTDNLSGVPDLAALAAIAVRLVTPASSREPR
jgi:hypothetical protein